MIRSGAVFEMKRLACTMKGKLFTLGLFLMIKIQNGGTILWTGDKSGYCLILQIFLRCIYILFVFTWLNLIYPEEPRSQRLSGSVRFLPDCRAGGRSARRGARTLWFSGSDDGRVQGTRFWMHKRMFHVLGVDLCIMMPFICCYVQEFMT